MNSVSVNLYSYYSNYVFLYNFAWLDVSEFWTKLAKMWSFFSIIQAWMRVLSRLSLCHNGFRSLTQSIDRVQKGTRLETKDLKAEKICLIRDKENKNSTNTKYLTKLTVNVADC